MRVLLLRGSYIVVPSFNNFVTRCRPTQCVGRRGLCLPPMHAVNFGPRLAVGSNLLIRSCVRTRRASFPSTAHVVRRRMTKLGRRLCRGKYARVRNVKILRCGVRDACRFRPGRSNTLSPALCKLDSFSVGELRCLASAASTTAERLLPQRRGEGEAMHFGHR